MRKLKVILKAENNRGETIEEEHNYRSSNPRIAIRKALYNTLLTEILNIQVIHERN
jgi:hypothetical protein